MTCDERTGRPVRMFRVGAARRGGRVRQARGASHVTAGDDGRDGVFQSFRWGD